MAAAIKRSSERGQEDGAPTLMNLTVSETSPMRMQMVLCVTWHK